MRSRKSYLWKKQHTCSEADLAKIAREWVQGELRPLDRVLVEGPLGAGKSTLVKYLLQELQVVQPPEGSPSFPIAHEYYSPEWGEIIHIDFYRLRSEQEIFDGGIEEYFWGRSALVICEWLSLWPNFLNSVLEHSPLAPQIWRVDLTIEDEEHRSLMIHREVY